MDEAKKDILKCRDYQCRKGVIDTTNKVVIQIGCSSFTGAFPCSVCGRLHWRDGSPVRNRRGERAFWKKGGERYNLTRKGEKRFL